MIRLRAVARSVAAAALVACSVDPRVEENPAQVTEATLADGKADGVFGQADLTHGGAPAKVSAVTVSHAAGLAIDLAAPDLLVIADTGASRAFAITVPSFGPTPLLQGQADFVSGSPNRGLGAPQFVSLSQPTAIARLHEFVAVADTGNHRVIIGNALGFPAGVVGQGGVGNTAIPNRGGVTNDSLLSPQGVALGELGSIVLLIADTGNHRVLGYGTDLPALTRAPLALFVVGQGSFTTGSLDRGMGSAADDRLFAPQGLATYAFDPSGVARSPEDGFYIADTGNHRVLHYGWCGSFKSSPRPCERADRVWGQPDFRGQNPRDGADGLDTPVAVAVDRNRGIWVADAGHHRVLHFKRTATKADLVLGQPDFDHGDPPATTSATTLHAPSGLAVSPVTGDLYVADEADSRILRYAFVHGPDECDDDDPCTVDTVAATGCVHELTPRSPACFPYLCDLTTRTCAVDCGTFGCQDPLVCVGSRGLGLGGGRCEQQCPSGAGCRKGTCVDGWCCNSACTGVCESCNQSDNWGRCLPITGDPARAKLASCAALSPDADCAGTCDGRSTERCAPTAKGTSCGVDACADGVESGAATCDGAGACAARTTPCFPYACDATRCRTRCFGDPHCADGARCIDGACIETSKAIVASGGCGVAAGEASSLGLPVALAAALGARRRARARAAARLEDRS